MKQLIFLILAFLLIISACKKDDDPQTLAAPVATDASDLTNDGFTANWNPSSGANDYELDVATDNAFNNIVESLKNLAPSSEAIDGLEDNTEYFYRVRATLNGTNPSANSNTINVITSPDAPVATNATNISSSGFTANWDAVDGITNYVLYISTDNFTSDPPVYVPGYDGAVIDGTSHIVTGLESNTFYYYAVRSKADARVSEVSNSIAVETELD
jgi:hypothetical protein